MELSLSRILRSVPYSFCTLEAFRILSILWSVYGCPRRNRPVSSLYTSTYLKSSELRKENSDVWCRLRAKREGANGSGHFFPDNDAILCVPWEACEVRKSHLS